MLNSLSLSLIYNYNVTIKLIKIESCRRRDSQAFYYKIDLGCSRIAQFAHAQYVAHGSFFPRKWCETESQFCESYAAGKNKAESFR